MATSSSGAMLNRSPLPFKHISEMCMAVAMVSVWPLRSASAGAGVSGTLSPAGSCGWWMTKPRSW